ncbi:unnamed protein product [Schistosoma curassoni]|uniref:FLYWCH-type domain-containing protein n=1 Tax=Schistosoma curassoni TaxID=6186 RepID=A0A183JFD1_9TREM|nr:unnamed protein product [Schistosoma curassoni]
MNSSLRSKYCHCESGFRVRGANNELKVTSVKTMHNYPSPEGYASIDHSR